MSQDVNTPRVIASHFLARAPAGRTPFLRKVPPESLPMMDEVDGKPGPVALQFGHLDALNRVPTASLSLPPKFTVILSQPMGAPSLRRLCFCRKGGKPRLLFIRSGPTTIGPAISGKSVRNHRRTP